MGQLVAEEEVLERVKLIESEWGTVGVWVASTKKAARQGISCWERVGPDNAGAQESDLDGQHEFVAVSAKSKGKARKQSAKRLKKRARWLHGARPLLGIAVPDRMRSSTQARLLGIFGWPTSHRRRQQHASLHRAVASPFS
jgi:hypothetical protein